MKTNEQAKEEKSTSDHILTHEEALSALKTRRQEVEILVEEIKQLRATIKHIISIMSYGP